MSWIKIGAYLTGFPVFGVAYFFLNGTLDYFWFLGDPTSNTYVYAQFMWDAIVIIYIIGGALWAIRAYSKPKIQGGF